MSYEQPKPDQPSHKPSNNSRLRARLHKFFVNSSFGRRDEMSALPQIDAFVIN